MILEDNSVLLPLRDKPSFNDFLEILKVKPTNFSKLILKDIYNEIFIYSRELKAEYEKFYYKEYDNFNSFIEIILGIPLDKSVDIRFLFHFNPSEIIISPDYDTNYLSKIIKELQKNEN